MAKRKKAQKRRPAKAKPVFQVLETPAQRLERFVNLVAPDMIRRLDTAEARAQKAEQDLTFLNVKLAGLLSRDQLEAAKICGCTPQVYAIECIELWKEQIFPYFAKHVRPLAALKAEIK